MRRFIPNVKSVSISTLIIVITLLFLDASSLVYAQSKFVTFRAEVHSQTEVALTWKIAPRYSAKMQKICVQRLINSKYSSIFCIPKSMSKGLLVDSGLSQGTATYRLLASRKGLRETFVRRIQITTTEDTEIIPPIPSDIATPTPTIPPEFISSCPSGLADQVIRLVNEVRLNAGVAALAYEQKLAVSADVHARSNARTNTLTHDGWAQEIIDTGFIFSAISQNIASASDDPTLVVSLWLNSPSHRGTILRPDLTHTGVSCALSSNGLYYWAQNFGIPR